MTLKPLSCSEIKETSSFPPLSCGSLKPVKTRDFLRWFSYDTLYVLLTHMAPYLEMKDIKNLIEYLDDTVSLDAFFIMNAGSEDRDSRIQRLGKLLVDAAVAGDAEIVSQVFGTRVIYELSSSVCAAFVQAHLEDRGPVINVLIQKHPFPDETLRDHFNIACEFSSFSVLDVLQNLPAITPAMLYTEFSKACRKGDLSLVQHLKENSRLGEGIVRTEFSHALQNGNLPVVNLLIDHPAVDNTIFFDTEFCCACRSGDLNRIKNLKENFRLSDGIVRTEFSHALWNGNLTLADLLKDHSAIDTKTIDDNFKEACPQGKPEIVTFLLSHPKLSGDTLNALCFQTFCHGDEKIAQLLLPRINRETLTQFYKDATSKGFKKGVDRLGKILGIQPAKKKHK